MKRISLLIGLLVFFFSTTAELAAIQMMHGSLLAWIQHPRRLALLTTSLAINLLNAVIAALLVYWMQQKALLLKRTEHERREINKYLNHHVRNALCSLQYATYGTGDKQAIRICDQAIARIVHALVDAERRAQLNWERDVFTTLGEPDEGKHYNAN